MRNRQFNFLNKSFFTSHLLFYIHLNITSNTLFIKRLYSLYNWNNVSFFMKFQTTTKLNLRTINKLKNIFNKFLKDPSVWNEIHRMINLGLIDFSKEFVYLTEGFPCCSYLSIFLSEIFFSEFDFNGFNLFLQYNSFRNLIINNKGGFFINYGYFYNMYSALRLERILFKFMSLEQLYPYYCKNLRGFLQWLNKIKISFNRYIFYVRYKDQILFGIVGSFNLSVLILGKIRSFFQLSKFSFYKETRILNSRDSLIFFLGFNIRICHISKDGKIIPKGIYFRFLLNLERFRTKFTKLFIKRLRSQFLNVFSLTSSFVSNSVLEKQKFWKYVFQFESLRSFQSYVRFVV